MTRRSLAALVVAAAMLPMAPGARAAAAPEYPRSDCSKRFIDPPDDDAGPLKAATKTSGLDIVGGFLRVTDDSVAVYLQVKDIPTTMPAWDPAYRYNAEFKYNNVLFQFKQIYANPTTSAALFTSPGATDPKITAPAGITGFTGGVDKDKEFFWIIVPRAKFEEKAGIPLEEGAEFTNVRFWTEWLANEGSPQGGDKIPADANPAPPPLKWTVTFDDYCFGMPPAVLSDLTVKTPKVQYGDPITVSAKLVSDKGTALEGKPVKFTLPGDTVGGTGTTNAEGIATATFVSKAVASATPYLVTASFAADAENGKAKLVGPGTVTVSQEKTALTLKVVKPSATARTVTATLLDDDKKPVTGVKVEWLVNGKKVATLTTNPKGQTTYSKAKPGQYVQVRFLAVAGKYLAATSPKVKL